MTATRSVRAPTVLATRLHNHVHKALSSFGQEMPTGDLRKPQQGTPLRAKRRSARPHATMLVPTHGVKASRSNLMFGGFDAAEVAMSPGPATQLAVALMVFAEELSFSATTE